MNPRFLPLLFAAVLASEGRSNPETPEALAVERRFAEAAAGFVERSREFERQGQKAKATGDLINAAACLKATGDLSVADELIRRAERLLPKGRDPRLEMLLMAQHGSVLALGKRPSDAVPKLEAAARMAAAAADSGLLADIRNDLGIAQASAGDPVKALGSFGMAETMARESGDAELELRCRHNHLVAAFCWWDDSRQALERAEELDGWTLPLREELERAGRGFDASFRRSQEIAAAGAEGSLEAYHALGTGMAGARQGRVEEGFVLLRIGLDAARRGGDFALERSGLLALAEIYLNQGRPGDALAVVDSARTVAGDPDVTQTGQLELIAARCHHQLDPGGEAELGSLTRAIESFGTVRSDIARTQEISDLGRSFRERVGNAYLMLADYHLGKARGTGVEEAAKKAREAVEGFKAWELQDFYRDDCVNLALSRKVHLDEVSDPGVAVLYVIPLETRTEILLGHRGKTLRWTSPVSGRDVAAHARRLRQYLESDYGAYRYLDEAEALYEALIRPIESYLKAGGVNHLVFVPDGPLGGVPLATLFDKRRKVHLIQDYSVSVSPSLSLTELKALPKERTTALVFGTDEAFLGFSALPAVRHELDELGQIYREHPVRENRAFTLKSLQAGVKDIDAAIIHIACHGEFLGKAGESFLVASDQKVRLDDLENAIRPKKFLGNPVELLCLSACRTAAGDDRAALGLAGAAVKSGSRSVLATLWYVDDRATAEIMVDFHRRLRTAGKADALRQAQLAWLAKDPLVAHPREWAPFILIGNWK